MAETALAASLNLNVPGRTAAAAYSGRDPEATDAVNGNSFTNSGEELLFVDNTGATGRTIQFRNSAGVNVGAEFTVAGGDSCVFGPFSVTDFGATVNFTSAHAELVCAVVNLSRLPHTLTT